MSTYKGRWFIGIPRDNDAIAFLFQALTHPTEQSHGHLYYYAYGPFRTRKAALAYSLHYINRFLHRAA